MSSSRLFKPLKVGSLNLSHRIALAPLTRFRADDDHVPLPFVAEYYAQRAAVSGTFLVSEATDISTKAVSIANIPGIYSQAQIDAWKRVTDAVHAKGSYIYLQLWHPGRVADPKLSEKNGIEVVSSSAVPLDGSVTPKPLSVEEIRETVQDFAQAAKNAIVAGFDGVEIHASNGCLIDQFIQDTVNQRTDSYGGSIDNRSRFAVEVTQAVIDAIGADRTGFRISPFSTFQGMLMKDPVPQFSDLVTKINKLGVAYLHLIESRVSGIDDVERQERLDPLVRLFDGPLLIAGGYKPDSAKAVVDAEYKDRDVIIVFGRYFTSSPDLVFRLKEGIELTHYDRNTFYNAKSERGYTDWPFSKEFSEAIAKA